MPKTTKKAKRTTAKRSTTKSKSVSAKFASATGDVQAQAVAVGKKANTLAKKNPWVLAGITAGLGLAVGILSTRGKGKGKKKR